jgi:hypothetical protein
MRRTEWKSSLNIDKFRQAVAKLITDFSTYTLAVETGRYNKISYCVEYANTVIVESE